MTGIGKTFFTKSGESVYNTDKFQLHIIPMKKTGNGAFISDRPVFFSVVREEKKWISGLGGYPTNIR